jgi:RHS repeat-associated protein
MDQKDGSGLVYRRNRYYDPITGRFTQEDPIGIAGGLNLYGFAEGDPVSFTDPFGLCPFTKSNESCFQLLANWGARTGRGWAVNLGAGLEAVGHAGNVFMGGGCTSGYACGMGVPAGQSLFSGSRAALRELLRTGWIEGMSGSQGLKILGRLSKGAVDDISITAGENKSVVASFIKLLDEGNEVVSFPVKLTLHS